MALFVNGNNLLTLPTEIRVDIYQQVFSRSYLIIHKARSEDAIAMKKIKNGRRRETKKIVVQTHIKKGEDFHLSLLQTCQFIRLEARPYFWQNIVLRFINKATLFDLGQDLAREAVLRHIRHLSIEIHDRNISLARQNEPVYIFRHEFGFLCLKGFCNLESVTLRSVQRVRRSRSVPWDMDEVKLQWHSLETEQDCAEIMVDDLAEHGSSKWLLPSRQSRTYRLITSRLVLFEDSKSPRCKPMVMAAYILDVDADTRRIIMGAWVDDETKNSLFRDR